jgi:LysM repeat protein
MIRQIPRVPVKCPPGFLGRYTVQPGDTMFKIAMMYRVRLDILIAKNPHISNPSLIFPGDVLCVPAQIPIPCCIILKQQVPQPLGIGAVAFVHFNFGSTESVSILANLPAPSTFRNFDTYFGEVSIPDIGTFGNLLFPTAELTPTYALTLDFTTAVQLTAASTVVIRPGLLQTSLSGPVILAASLGECKNCKC